MASALLARNDGGGEMTLIDAFAVCFAAHVGTVPLSALAPLALTVSALLLVRRAMLARDAHLGREALL
jgi:hypothetical protein